MIFSLLLMFESVTNLYTSGTVFHSFLGERLPDWKAAASLVRKIAENYSLPTILSVRLILFVVIMAILLEK